MIRILASTQVGFVIALCLSLAAAAPSESLAHAPSLAQATHIIKCPEQLYIGVVNTPEGWGNDTRYPLTNLGIHIESEKTKGGTLVRCAYRDKDAQYYYLNRHVRVGVTCEKVDNYSIECRVGFKKKAL